MTERSGVWWEVVVSKARAGVSRAEIVEIGRQIQAWARGQTGLLDRTLVEDAIG
jgi:hypothetical protein